MALQKNWKIMFQFKTGDIAGAVKVFIIIP